MNTIPYSTRQEVYKKAQHQFGNTNQTIVAIEELSELAKELCKLIRYPHEADIQCLAEEMADVTIMLEQIRQMYDINDEVCSWMDYKVARLQERVMEARKNEGH
jgi:NTP pyrophosphatase (non-canonical NTP hydrolase)